MEYETNLWIEAMVIAIYKYNGNIDKNEVFNAVKKIAKNVEEKDIEEMVNHILSLPKEKLKKLILEISGRERVNGNTMLFSKKQGTFYNCLVANMKFLLTNKKKDALDYAVEFDNKATKTVPTAAEPTTSCESLKKLFFQALLKSGADPRAFRRALEEGEFHPGLLQDLKRGLESLGWDKSKFVFD